MRRVACLLLLLGFARLAADAAEKTNSPIVVTAPAKLEVRGEWIYLTIDDGKHNYELPWAMPPHYTGSVALESNRVYTFTVIEEPFRRGTSIAEVVRVERDGKMIYDREVCEVHHAKMELKTVRIAYGLVMPSPGEPSGETELRLFPHRREIAFGGCCVDSDSPKTDKVYVCTRCKEEYQKWVKEHPKAK